MRFAFWRAGKDKAMALVERVIAKPLPAVAQPAITKPVTRQVTRPAVAKSAVARQAIAPQSGDLDLHALGQALIRKRGWILVPTVLALVLSLAAVNMITPRYKSEARILVDGRENVFMRPNGERTDDRNAVDAEAMTSQVQLLLSRDLAREIIKKNKLAERPEFDPVLHGFSPLKSLLALFGIGRDPLSMTPEERVLDAYFERYTAYAVDKSRVIVIEFQSRDPELAARVANSIAEGYLALQQGARKDQAKSASGWLSGEIENLRKRVLDAESRVEEFRSKSSLFIGTNNTSLSNQQMGEINTQLNNARALKSDAETKARLIKDMLQSGKPIEASEVLNSEAIRGLADRQAAVRAQLAEQSSTLLDGHPRIKELKAQLAATDRQLREKAGEIARSLETAARAAGVNVDSLTNALDQAKKQASTTNGHDVQLRALEREAKAQRDLLESYLAKYREATARENIEAAPADGRIISRATVSNVPAYPKKLPIVLIATLATLLLTSGTIITGELLRMTAPRTAAVVTPDELPVAEPPHVAAPPTAPDFEAHENKRAVFQAEATKPADLAPEDIAAAITAPRVELAAGIDEVEQLADRLAQAGGESRKITVLGTAPSEAITLTALTLARLMARRAKIAVVDLAASSPTMTAVSVDPSAPGLAELMRGEASFAQIITKDRFSPIHLVSAGRPGFDRSHLQSPRLALAIDALLRVYDHVLLDAGAATDLPAELLTAHARAVVVPDASLDRDARSIMSDQLRAVGFADVAMLSKACQPSEAAPRAVAAE